jgi:hypothetical protein
MDLNAIARMGQRIFDWMAEGDEIAGEISSSGIPSRRMDDIAPVSNERQRLNQRRFMSAWC